VHLVLLDLIPMLLSWDPSAPGEAPAVPASAANMLAQVFPDFRIAGISDGSLTGLDLRRALEDAELDGFFDFIGTSAEFGPEVSPRVVRRLARVLGFPLEQVVVITARTELADALQQSGLAVIHVEGEEGVGAIPQALEALYSGYFSP
jgi:FMN phosphatase YigB (HAD superfamily)